MRSYTNRIFGRLCATRLVQSMSLCDGSFVPRRDAQPGGACRAVAAVAQARAARSVPDLGLRGKGRYTCSLANKGQSGGYSPSFNSVEWRVELASRVTRRAGGKLRVPQLYMPNGALKASAHHRRLCDTNALPF